MNRSRCRLAGGLRYTRGNTFYTGERANPQQEMALLGVTLGHAQLPKADVLTFGHERCDRWLSVL